MAFSGPPIGDDRLLMGVSRVSDSDSDNGANYITEPPADDCQHDVNRIMGSNEGNNLPVSVSSHDEEEGKVEVVNVAEGEVIPPISSHGEDEFDKHGCLTDDDEDRFGWNSRYRGYDSLFEDEEDVDDTDDDQDSFGWNSGYPEYDSLFEDEEDVDDDDGIRPCSPLVQQSLLDQQLDRLEDLLREFCLAGNICSVAERSLSQRSEESAPSTSGLGSSRKRSREENCMEQVSAKRWKWNHEDSP